jgi:2-oxoglutarate ferredoxin oxidoreductase subunit alpha
MSTATATPPATTAPAYTSSPAESLAYKNTGAPIVNDVVITVATANGSGSQTSNNVLMRSIHRMGVPCNGKNLFPSNIQGLPTWFTIRANKDGWIGRKRKQDITICMNPETAVEDMQTAPSGSVLIFDDSLGIGGVRKDLLEYGAPFKKLVAACCPDAKLRKYVVNMLYVGVCVELLGLDMGIVKKALAKELKGKTKAIALNEPALDAGADYARTNFKKLDRFRIEPANKTQGTIIITGNDASALGAMYGGCNVLTWYPITPSSSLCEALIDYMEEHRVAADGKKTFVHIQAEDEIASVGMAIGAGWAGARSMTATSGPGISLMNEFIGLAYYAEIPVVIGDVCRVGPSTGLPTRTMQSDTLLLYHASHGDTRHVVLIPGNVSECFDMYAEAFDLAADFQTPIFVYTDLDLGMNNWPSKPFKTPTAPLHHGKVLDEAAFKAMADWGRYKDVDGDGIGYRTLPGSFMGGAFFTRGSGHNEYAKYSEKSEDWRKGMDRLERKLTTARGRTPQPVVDGTGSKIGLIAYGTSDFAVQEAIHRHRSEGGRIDYLRIRSLPLSAKVREFIAAHDKVFVCEQNAHSQMMEIMRFEMPEFATKMVPLLHYDGLPLPVETVYEGITGTKEAVTAQQNGAHAKGAED